MTEIATISTAQLEEKRRNLDVQLIDVRPADAYNGWRLQNELRGGHIPGARSLPLKWASYIDWIEIIRNKNITPDQHIIVYGYQSEDSEYVAERFVKAGYDRVSVYNDFPKEWVPDERNTLVQLFRYKNLVHAGWIKDVIDGKVPESHPGGRTVICHAHYRNRDAYLSGHIPGAIDIDTNSLESLETWNRRTPGELKKTLEAHGIDHNTTVILYGKYMDPDNADEFPGSAAGDIGAIRCALIMMYAGVKDVRVLNGGFHYWEHAGYEVHTDDVAKKRVKAFGRDIPANPQLMVDLDKAKQMIAADDAELVCVRSVPEFLGEVSGYNYIDVKGRIPGAVFVEGGSDAYHMENYRNLDYSVREFQEVQELWRQAGLSPDKHLAFYCGTGWRGSEAWFNAWLMGWPEVSVFDGGWFEWSNDPSNPYETGPVSNKRFEV